MGLQLTATEYAIQALQIKQKCIEQAGWYMYLNSKIQSHAYNQEAEGWALHAALMDAWGDIGWNGQEPLQ